MGTLYGVKVPQDACWFHLISCSLLLYLPRVISNPHPFPSYPHPFHSTLSLFILLSFILSYLHPCLSTPILSFLSRSFYPTLIFSILPSSFPSYLHPIHSTPQLSILTRSFHPSLTLILSILPLSVFHTILILSILPSSLHLTLILFLNIFMSVFYVLLLLISSP